MVDSEQTGEPSAADRRYRLFIGAGIILLVIAGALTLGVLSGLFGGAGDGIAAGTPGGSGSAGLKSPTPLEELPPGRDDIPEQPGLASQIFIIVDASETDDVTAAGIRAGLVDFVQQLPDYDTLTVVASGDAVRRVVDRSSLDRAGRDAAIEDLRAMQFGGARQLVRGVDAALQVAEEAGKGSYEAVLIATGVDGSTRYELRDAGRRLNAGGESAETWFRLHGIAIGHGDQERLMSRLDGTYGWAESGSDLVRALTTYRLLVTEGTLIGFGPVEEAGSSQDVLVGPNRFAVRVSVYAPQRGLTVVAESPTGRRYDSTSHGEGITVQELGDRVTLVVNGASPGTWKLHFQGTLPNGAQAWYEAEETLTLVHILTTAYGTGDTIDDLRTGVALLHSDGTPGAATATITAPGGARWTVPLAPIDRDELNIGAELTLGAIIGDLKQAGSYSVVIELDLTDGSGEARHLAWLEGAYVLPNRDSDGDGVRDALEERFGMDPSDPSDGLADHDGDGLSTGDEMTVYGTSPGDWDTDGGGESDGSEVAAGRDPLNPADDQPEVTCLELMPTPDPAATFRPGPTITPEPAPELEALLPDRVLGHPTTKTSMHDFSRQPWIFGIFDAFLPCTGAQQEDMSLAVAYGQDLGGWSVVALQIDGVSGEELEDIWLYRLDGPFGLYTDAEVDGRSYVQAEPGWATYATADTFFWITNLSFGEPAPDETPVELPDSRTIIEAFIRQLPLD